jgi:hypothetical protein
MTETQPQPESAGSSAELVTLMQQLRQWAGLSYRQLERRAEQAGDALPRATLAGALSRSDLPRPDLLAAYVRACGCDADTVNAWLEARRRIAVGAAAEQSSDPVEEPVAPVASPEPAPAAARPGSKRRRVVVATASTAVAALLAGAFTLHQLDQPADQNKTQTQQALPTPVVTVTETVPGAAPESAAASPSTPAASSASPGGGSRPGTGPQPATPPAAEAKPAPTPTPPAAGTLPPSGFARIQPAGSGLCLTEGLERDRSANRTSEVAVQLPCGQQGPRTYLEKVGADTYQIQWHNPGKGVGCLGVDGAYTGVGALMGPGDCTNKPYHRFRLEPVAGGFRLRPAHSNLCIGLQAPIAQGAEAIQQKCGAGTGQIFQITAG